MKKIAITGHLLVVVLLLATSAQAQTLYGAISGANSPLFIINPATGATTQVGMIGFGITGLAEHPITRELYGTEGGVPDDVFTRRLIRIDKTTGAGTVIGNIGLGFGGIADIAFRADGTLFGWSESSDDLITLNLTTGAGTIVGNAGISTRGSGLAFNAAGTLYLAGNNGNGPLRTVNTTTGLTTVGPTLSGAPFPTAPIPALKFHPVTDVLYGVNRQTLGLGGSTFLITINPTTGVITTIGATVDRLDAIVWTAPTGPPPPPLPPPPPSLTEIVPSTGSTLGGTTVTLRGSDFQSNPQVFFDGIAATNVVFVNSSTVTAVTPAHAAGAVNVMIRNSDGRSSTLVNGFTYAVPAPTPSTVTLTVQLRGLGSGRVVSAPAGIACGTDCTESYTDVAATQVTLTAIPAADAVFGGFTGDADCADGSVTMTANRTCSARFERLPGGRPLDINADGRGDIVGYSPGGADGGGGAITVLLTDAGVLRGGDFNGDRLSDIFSYNPVTGGWTINLGSSIIPGSTAPRQSPLVVDVNGDSRADVVFHNPATASVQPCISVGGPLDCRTAATVPSNVAAFPLDLHGDGLGDLLLYRWATGEATFLVANAGGTFGPTSLSINVGANLNVLTVDVNGDRRTDVIANDPVGGATTLFTNTGGAFTPSSLGVLPGYTVHAGNFGNSVGADLVAYNAATGQTLHAHNTGSGFTVVSSSLPAGRQVSVTDLDGDRDVDLILYNPATGAATIAISQANGTFTQSPASGPPGLIILAQQSAP